MNYDLLLLAGGRTRDNRRNSWQAALSVARVLPEVKTARAWLDEHAQIWLEGKQPIRVAMSAGCLFDIDNQQIIIGQQLAGESVGKVWLMDEMAQYGNILGYLNFAGLEFIGSDELLVRLARERDFLPKLFPAWKFNKGGFKVWSDDWSKRYSEIVEQIMAGLALPLKLRSGRWERVVLVKEDLENAIFSLLERSGAEYIEVSQTFLGGRTGVISFIGRANFLPSRLVEYSQGTELALSTDQNLERQVQEMIVSLVKNYAIFDYGLIRLNINETEWEIDRLELLPPIGQESDLAKIWQLSGLNYNELVNKIYREAVKNETGNTKG